MIDLNVRALTELSVAFLDSLMRHREGILNVASVAAFTPGSAWQFIMPASLCAFVQRSFAPRLSSRGVRVTALCRGPVPLQARAGLSGIACRTC